MRQYPIDASSPAFQASLQTLPADQLDQIQQAWGAALRQPEGRDRDAALANLAALTQELSQQFGACAKAHLWNGIVLAGYAKAVGGLCALQLLKASKNSLELAIRLAPEDGAAYLQLGLLYQNAPEAPYGFGDEAQAKVWLEKGLQLTLREAQQQTLQRVH